MPDTDELLDCLRSRSAHVRAAALERAVLAALNWHPDDLPLRRLGHCYRELSASILSASAAGGLATGGLGNMSDREAAVIWGVIYGLRSFHVADRILTPTIDFTKGLTEVGGGWGPIALWSALRGGTVRIVEQSAARRSFGASLFSSLGLSADWSGRWRGPSDLGDMQASVWSFSLREMAGDPDAAHRLLLQSLDHLGPDGRIVVMESGARAGSEFLMEVRDRMLKAGVAASAPCWAKGMCPMRAAEDWCHFTWRLGLGPIGQRIAALAGRKAHEVHVSWLSFGRVVEGGGAGRVLAVRSLGKQGLRLTLCRGEGRQVVDVPRKLARSHHAFEEDLVGLNVWVPSAEASFRVRAIDELKVVSDDDVSHGT